MTDTKKLKSSARYNKKDTQRARQFKNATIPLSYISRFDQDDINSIAFALIKATNNIVTTMPALESPTEELLHSTHASLCDATYFGAMTAIKTISASAILASEEGKSYNQSLSQLILISALYGAIFANSNCVDCRVGFKERTIIDKLAKELMDEEYSLAIVESDEIFDTQSNEPDIDNLTQHITKLTNKLEKSLKEIDRLKGKLKDANRKQASEKKRHKEQLKEKDNEIDKLKKELSHADDRIQEAAKASIEIEKAAQDASSEAEAAKATFEKKLKELSIMPNIAAPAENMWREVLLDGNFTTFRTANDVIATCQMVYDNELIFSQKAIKDATNFTGNPDEIWNILSTLVNEFLPSCRQGRPIESRAFSEKTGVTITANESSSTENSKRLAKMRTAIINGKPVFGNYHAKGGSNKPGQCLRIYFAYDPKTTKLAIIRCGKHLETAGTKKRGI